jgi:hypothetical protein
MTGTPALSAADRAQRARVRITAVLDECPHRAPEFAAESNPMHRLAQSHSSSAGAVLQTHGEIALDLCGAGSAGIKFVQRQAGLDSEHHHCRPGAAAIAVLPPGMEAGTKIQPGISFPNLRDKSPQLAGAGGVLLSAGRDTGPFVCNQRYRASGLNLVVAAITLWNTAYLERSMAALRQQREIDDRLIPHVAPLGWTHINLTGDYVWAANKRIAKGQFRPLRAVKSTRVRPYSGIGAAQRCVAATRLRQDGLDAPLLSLAHRWEPFYRGRIAWLDSPPVLRSRAETRRRRDTHDGWDCDTLFRPVAFAL